MKVQGNRYINNPEMIKNKVEKKTTVPQNIISEDDVKISDSARKLVETARNKVSDFHTMHFSSINGEIREIPAEYKCENLFKLDLKATSISGEQSAFEGCSENQSSSPRDLIFRIEDTDSNRFVPGAEEYILESFKWLGKNQPLKLCLIPETRRLMAIKCLMT